ncbi:hypothetical protein RCL1_007140 [Eukaryota sp. TZLM3-RCL]
MQQQLTTLLSLLPPSFTSTINPNDTSSELSSKFLKCFAFISKSFRDERPNIPAQRLHLLCSFLITQLLPSFSSSSLPTDKHLCYELLGCTSALLAFDSDVLRSCITKQLQFFSSLFSLLSSTSIDPSLVPRLFSCLGFLVHRSQGKFADQLLSLYKKSVSTILTHINDTFPNFLILSSALRCYSLLVPDYFASNFAVTKAKDDLSILFKLFLKGSKFESKFSSPRNDDVLLHVKTNSLNAILSLIKIIPISELIFDLLPTLSRHSVFNHSSLSNLIVSESQSVIRAQALDCFRHVLIVSTPLLSLADDSQNRHSFVSKSAQYSMMIRGSYHFLSSFLIDYKSRDQSEIVIAIKCLSFLVDISSFSKFFPNISSDLVPILIELWESFSSNLDLLLSILTLITSLARNYSDFIQSILIDSNYLTLRPPTLLNSITSSQSFLSLIFDLSTIPYFLPISLEFLLAVCSSNCSEIDSNLLTKISALVQQSFLIDNLTLSRVCLKISSKLVLFDSTLILNFQSFFNLIFDLLPSCLAVSDSLLSQNCFDFLSNSFNHLNSKNLNILLPLINQGLEISRKERLNNVDSDLDESLIASSIKFLGVVAQKDDVYNDLLIVYEIVKNCCDWISAKNGPQSILIAASLALGNVTSIFNNLVESFSTEINLKAILSEIFNFIVEVSINGLNSKFFSERVKHGLLRSIGFLSSHFELFFDLQSNFDLFISILNSIKFSLQHCNLAKTKWNCAYSAGKIFGSKFFINQISAIKNPALYESISDFILTLIRFSYSSNNFKVRSSCLSALLNSNSIINDWMNELICVVFINIVSVKKSVQNSNLIGPLIKSLEFALVTVNNSCKNFENELITVLYNLLQNSEFINFHSKFLVENSTHLVLKACDFLDADH